MSEGVAIVTDSVTLGEQSVGELLQNVQQPTAVADWRSELDDDLKSSKALEKIKSVADLAKGYVNAQSLIGKRVQELPEAELRALMQERLGAPKAVEEYDFNVELLDPADVGQFKVKALEAGLSKDAALKVAAFLNERESRTISNKKAAEDAVRARFEEVVRAEFGDQVPVRMKHVEAALKEFADPELYNFIRDEGHHSPELIKMLARVGRTLSNHELIHAATPKLSGTSKDAASEELTKLKGDQSFMRLLAEPYAVGHKEARQKFIRLSNIVSG